MNTYVVGFIYYRDQVILIIKNRPEWQVGLFNGIGGKMELNETPEEAMNRECKEELGLDLSWFEYSSLHGKDFLIYVFSSKITKEQYLNLPEVNDVGEVVIKIKIDDIKSEKCVDKNKVLIELGRVRKQFTYIDFYKK